MSPPGGPRCPPALLLLLLLALAASRGLPECLDRAAPAGSSLCLEPEKPPWEWAEIHWKAEEDPQTQQRILTANRTGILSRPKGSFHGRTEFRPDTLALCISPVLRGDNRVYLAEFEFENSPRIFTRCFRVSVWDPIPEPSLESQILARDQGWCLLSLLCSSPGNVSYSWACPEDPPESPEFPEFPEIIPEIPSRITRRVPEGAEPQMCLCNVTNPSGWSSAGAPLTCPEIPEIFGHWMLVAVASASALTLTLLLLGCCCCCCRRRRKNSREGPPGPPPEQPLTLYAEVGQRKPRQDPEGATVYAVVTPQTPEQPRNWEKSQNVTIYSSVQFARRPSSIKRKRLDPALVSTAYLEDNGGYRRLGFPKPAGHQRP